jgi:hypothetical protein
MLSKERLELALNIHSLSYRLLRWITTAMDDGLIEVPRVRHHSDEDPVTSAMEWFEGNFEVVPPELRPDREYLQDFFCFFATYLMTSFDLISDPGIRLESTNGCYCDICSRLTNASHLKAKKLSARDQRRAEVLKTDRIIGLAGEEQIDCNETNAKALVSNPATREPAAYSAYGYWLIERLQGKTDGAAILALWREIAWKPEGSPIKDFRINYDTFFAAEELLVSTLRKGLPLSSITGA